VGNEPLVPKEQPVGWHGPGLTVVKREMCVCCSQLPDFWPIRYMDSCFS
jgi:hypothetical protein